MVKFDQYTLNLLGTTTLLDIMPSPCKNSFQTQKRHTIRSAGASVQQNTAVAGACSVHCALQLPYNIFNIYANESNKRKYGNCPRLAGQL